MFVLEFKEQKRILQLLHEGRSGGQLSDGVDQGVDPGGHLFAGFEPGAGSELLPNGLGSVGHEKQSDGSHADLGAFGNIGGQAEEDRVDLIGKFTKNKYQILH